MQVVEYIFWGISTWLGAYEQGHIDNSFEWNFITKAEMEEGDVRLSEIFRSDYPHVPSHLPAGKYSGCGTCPGGPSHGGLGGVC